MKKLALLLFAIFSFGWTADQVEVLSVSPAGRVGFAGDVKSITVTFNQPMVPLQASPSDLTEGPLQVQPPVKGRYRWQGTRTLAFIPEQPLKMASRYTVTIPAGVKAVSGATLASPYVWTIETLRPLLLGSRPEHDARQVTLDAAIFLQFNQTMEPARLSGKISVRDGKQSLPVRLERTRLEEMSWQLGSDSARVIKVIPQGLQKGRTYAVQIDKGVLAAEGDLGLEESKMLAFSTFGPQQFINFSSGGDEEDQQITPNSGIAFHFINPVAYPELVKKIRFEPAVEIPAFYSERTWPGTRLLLDLEFKPETSYTFTIPADLTDKFGNLLGETITRTFTTTSYPPRLSLNTGPGVLEAYGDRRYPCFFVNTNEVGLRMGLVPADRLVPLLLNPDSLYNLPEPLPAKWFMVDRSWSMQNPRNTKTIRPLEMDWLLAGRKTGLVLVELDDRISEESERYRRLFLQVTNMGVSAKFSPMNNLIWVTSLKDATPIVGAKVDIRDDQNNKLWSGVTNAQGYVESPGWRDLKVVQKDRWSSPRQWVIVSNGLDVAYTSSEWGTGIEPWRFDISYEWSPEPVKKEGVMFTDRNLYRAGETVHIKGLMREKRFSEWEVPAIKEVRLKVNDSRGNLVTVDTVAVSSYGSIHYDLALNPSAPLGYYDVVAESLNTSGDYYSVIMNSYFRVEAFRPAEFSVTMVPEQEHVILGDSVRAHVKGAYLFGAAMSKQQISWNMYLSRLWYTPPEYDRYFFGPSDWDDDSGFQGLNLGHGKSVFDADGQFHLKGKADAMAVDRPLSLSISAEVTSPNNQVIGTSAIIKVHPADFYIGLKPATTFTQINTPFHFEMVTVTPDGKPQPARNVKVKIVQRQWHSVRKAGVDGRYEWISKHVDTLVDSMMLTGQEKPVSGQFTVKAAGYYLLTAEGQDPSGRRTLSEVSFYAVGSGYVAWEREDDDRIQLVPDASRYKPGETARIMIKSPFEKAKGLVTLEREGVLWQTAVELNGSTPTIEIPIAEKYLPNVFVSVILLQGRTSNYVFSQEGEDVGRPAFKIGYVNLAVDAGSKHARIAVKSDKEEYRPAESVTVTLDVKDSEGRPVAAEVTLAVVDRGILNLTNYEMPDPFDQFYTMRPLSVQTSETRLHVVEQRNYGEKGEKRGGGGAEFADANADIRKNFKSAAYWNPALMTDSNGHAQVTFTLPDNLTSFKIMAVAQTLDAKFGKGANEFRVKLPMLLQASMPRFIRTGDQFEAGVVVHNYTGKKGKGVVEAEVTGVTLKGPVKTEFELEQGESRAILFPFAAAVVGEARFRFRCRMNDVSDGFERTIPVQSPGTRESVAVYKRVEESSKEQLQPPKSVHADLTKLEITAASSAMSEFSGAVEYLMYYPYECLEQRLSKALPVIVSADLVKTFNLPVKGEQTYQKIVTSMLTDLPRYQMEDGGFTAWPNGERSWPYISAYAAYGMTMAKKAGYKIDEEMLTSTLDYLRSVLNGDVSRTSYPYDDLSWKSTDAFILYVLSLNNRTDAGYVERLTTRSDDLPLEAQGHLLRTVHVLLTRPNQNAGLLSSFKKLLRKKAGGTNPLEARKAEMVQAMMNRLRVSPSTAYFEKDTNSDMAWIYHSTVRSTAQCLQTLLEVGAEVPSAEQVVKWLLTSRRDGHWSNTQENFYVLLALSTYFERFEKTEPQFQAEIKLAGQQAFAALFSGRSTTVQRKEISLASYGDKLLDVDIAKSGAGALYYGLRMSYYPLQVTEPRDQGFAVLKSVVPVQSELWPDGAYPVGQMVRVTLTVETPEDRHYVVVDDPIPAGWEPINVSLATVSDAVRMLDQQEEQPWWAGFTHVEKRDDRVLLFADYLNAGVHTYTYLARITSKGSFSLPPTKAEEMYTPEVFGRTVSKVVRVK